MSSQTVVAPDSICTIKESLRRHARYSLGKPWPQLSTRELFTAVALSVRDRLVDRMLETDERHGKADAKRLYYISIEFLIGRMLRSNLQNLGVEQLYGRALREMGVDLQELESIEEDAALGNGGLGRLAACFLDSLATLGMPGCGYGINYEYGLFKQEIDDGYQREKPDNWLAQSTPWELARSEEACIVPVYGHIEHALDRKGAYNPMWLGWRVLVGAPYDIPVAGYGAETVNFIRLYSARSSRDFDMQIFNDGDYFKAVEQKIASENVSKVLYPADALIAGRELRLVQEYFLVACAIRDITRRFQQTHGDFREFPAKAAIQLNDTHPALAVAELMRLLVDEKDFEWEEAWKVTQATLAYTNHTLVPEALEKWPVPLLETVLPRHMQIIYEINHRFLRQVSAVYPDDPDRQNRMSLIEESAPQQVRMTHLAIVGSHSINGVSAIHTSLIKASLVPDFWQLWPERFNNKTNGMSPRRWLLQANPALAGLIRAAIGDGWITDLSQLRGLEKWADDSGWQADFLRVKQENKQRLAHWIRQTLRISVDPASIFDVQVKRIHAYKRQLLNVMHIIHEYLTLVEDGREPVAPRAYIFAGKAAPGYWAAKQIIKLIHNVARVINGDSRATPWIKVVFLPDYRVSLAEAIIPAADLSEQISTAGMEASGTSNMKLALNGAVTIGTLDGANIEILEEVGRENIFIFGLEAADIQRMRRDRSYRPRDYYDQDSRVRRVADALASRRFCPSEPELFTWIFQAILGPGDDHFHLADLPAYLAAHERAAAAYRDRRRWARMSISNVARIGKFSSDRTILEYARDIWGIEAGRAS